MGRHTRAQAEYDWVVERLIEIERDAALERGCVYCGGELEMERFGKWNNRAREDGPFCSVACEKKYKGMWREPVATTPAVKGRDRPASAERLIGKFVSIRYEPIMRCYFGIDVKGVEAWVGTSLEKEIIERIARGEFMQWEDGDVTKT